VRSLEKRTIFNVSLEALSDLMHKSDATVRSGEEMKEQKFIANLKKSRKQLKSLRSRVMSSANFGVSNMN
jgi:hypothetical protein